MFGISSAPEKYQEVISGVIRGCSEVANIADDLIVHGADLEEHDRNFYAVLQRLRKSGLTLNGEKCRFRLHRLTLFGHDLSSQGVVPSEEKIAAVVNAQAPKNASEVRSFVQLVQYSLACEQALWWGRAKSGGGGGTGRKRACRKTIDAAVPAPQLCTRFWCKP